MSKIIKKSSIAKSLKRFCSICAIVCFAGIVILGHIVKDTVWHIANYLKIRRKYNSLLLSKKAAGINLSERNRQKLWEMAKNAVRHDLLIAEIQTSKCVPKKNNAHKSESCTGSSAASPQFFKSTPATDNKSPQEQHSSAPVCSCD